MNKDEIKELKDSIVNELRSTLVTDLKEIIVDANQFTITTLREEMKEMDSNLRALIHDESVKNGQLFDAVFADLKEIKESLPTMARDMESMRKDIVLLKMAVFGKESVMGEVT